MATESPRSFRGWLYAFIVAVCLLLIFFAGENLSRIKQPGFYNDARTATLSISTKPRNIPRIATQSIPLAIEPLVDLKEDASWINYRSAGQSTIAMIEPPAGARLSAPIATNTTDPFNDPKFLQRSPSELASEIASRNHTVATTVSTVVEPDPTTEHIAVIPSVKEANRVQNNCWPKSEQLESSISRVVEIAAERSLEDIRQWVTEIQTEYDALTETPIHDPASIQHFGRFAQLAASANELTTSLQQGDEYIAGAVMRLAYAIERRQSLWAAVHQCIIAGKERFVANRAYSVNLDQLTFCLNEVRKHIQKTGDPRSWHNYLMLDSIELLASGKLTDRQDQAILAREFLARVTDERVSPTQRAMLTSREVHKLADQVHPMSIGPVNYRKLLDDVETLESDPIHRVGLDVAEAMQSLRFSEHEEQYNVSQAIGTYYRNANVRLAVSEEFINRMIPKQSVTQKPVRQSILGADTRGASQIATKLKVDFLPDPAAWKVVLDLDGDISSDTRSSRNGATFYNSSIANVKAQREIRIDTKGMSIDGKPATVETNDSLQRFSTNWDSLPIFGDMVRHFAHQEFLQSRPIAKRIMQKTISKQTDQEFDQQLKTKVESAQTQFDKRLIGPLQTLNLQPMVMDMQTTDTRLVVRYRVASSNQIAAYTPRPIAPGDSQLSVQVHQSAFNNLASQMVAGDHDWSIQELSDKISDSLQLPRQPLDPETPTDVIVRFAEARPITIEFEDGRMWLTLRFASLEQPGRIHLKNFIIRTSYVPTINGLRAELERDGVISVDGHKIGMRDRLPLRAIFTKVFSNRSIIPMVSDELANDPRAEGLAVSQLEMRDGWLAVAISDTNSPHVARMQSAKTTTQR